MKVVEDLRTLLTKFTNKQFLMFIVSGGMNTLFTYMLYILLLQIASYPAAYTISYVIGILFAYVVNSKWVFKTPLTLRGLLRYPVVYIVQYGINVLLLMLAVDVLGWQERIALLAIMVVTVPLTFILNKLVLNRTK